MAFLDMILNPSTSAASLERPSASSPVDDTYTGSEANLKLGLKWLATCEEDHNICRRRRRYSVSGMSRLPTRVVRVGTPTTSPSIVTGAGSYGRYAILSHCWGDGVPYPTTMENYDLRCKSIPFETLPKTFQEAITVTRALELEYLWIDALCIIQDSSIDWQ